MHVLVCYMQLRQTTQHGCVTVLLYSSYRCGSSLSCICVERNTPFTYALHFICKCCVFHIYITITLFAVFNGEQLPTVVGRWCTLWHREGRGELLRFLRNPVRCVHKIMEHMCMTTYSYAIQPIFGSKQNSQTNSCMITECSIMHYNKSCIFFCFEQFSNMTNSELSF
jgi:hypothetical protein